MHLAYFALCAILVAGCASHGERPIVGAESVAPPGTHVDTGVEVRHMYLFSPGKAPVRIVSRDDLPASSEEVSTEPPSVR